MTSQDVTQRTPSQALVATIRSPDFQSQVALALPEGMPPARFVRIAATALLENPDIAEAQPPTILSALLKAAGDGLLPDGREAALSVYNDNKRGGKVAVYMPMVGGFRKIAAEHGWSLEAHAFYTGDEFDFALGDRPFVQHRPAAVDRGDLAGAYAVGRNLSTGVALVNVLLAPEVEKIRRKARRKEIWADWPEMMYAKTAARRLFKSLPLGDRDRVRRVLDADELEPGQAAALVYGSTPQGTTAALTAGDPYADSGAASKPAPQVPQPEAPAPFHRRRAGGARAPADDRRRGRCARRRGQSGGHEDRVRRRGRARRGVHPLRRQDARRGRRPRARILGMARV